MLFLNLKGMNYYGCYKGQEIWEDFFLSSIPPKKTSKILSQFLSSPLKSGRIKKFKVLYYVKLPLISTITCFYYFLEARAETGKHFCNWGQEKKILCGFLTFSALKIYCRVYSLCIIMYMFIKNLLSKYFDDILQIWPWWKVLQFD